LLNAEGILHRLTTGIAGLHLAVVGYGSIGQSAAALIMRHLGLPRRLTICDRPERLGLLETQLTDLRAQLGDRLLVTGRMDDVYLADLILGASSQGDLIDATRLQPATILLDDSFPSICPAGPALARMRLDADVLVAGAGRVDLGPVRHCAPLVAALLDRFAASNASQAGGLADLAGRFGPGMAGCRLEPLLLARQPDLAEVMGPVTKDQANAFLAAMRQLDVRPAALHLGTVILDDDLLGRFAKRWHGARASNPR